LDKEPQGTHWIAGSVGLGAGIDAVEKRNNFAVVRNQTLIPRSSSP
jgi:hypothetical protein